MMGDDRRHRVRIEDYALLGDCETAALVGRDGSVDWLCWPRFDSDACFAALLGSPEHGRWKIAPHERESTVRRRYRGHSLVLETEFESAGGTVALIDFMPLRGPCSDLVRTVEGRRGRVSMRSELVIRFDYGSFIPWVRRLDDMTLEAIAGPDRLVLRSDVPMRGENMRTVSEFTVAAGESRTFVLSHLPSHHTPPTANDPRALLAETEKYWDRWASKCNVPNRWPAAVLRSLVTLKALTYQPTGGIVAAPTTSLPEWPGGVRNWDYRFCWLRDATFTLLALMDAGYLDEARAWRDWLLRATAGSPSQIQTMYGLAGERRLSEWEVKHLPGHAGSRPVRIGNDAYRQLQIDVFGEVGDTLHQARQFGLPASEDGWELQKALTEHLARIWEQPDEGIWEVRGGRQQFTYSKVMAWVALDRAVKGVEDFKLSGPVERWKALRKRIHDEVCRHGYDEEVGAFVQSFGSKLLDASLLLVPLVGFLRPQDPRVRSTVEAIERRLLADGLVVRYDTGSTQDGLPPGEGVFLACSFWLADNLLLLGRRKDAERLFERLLGLRNDVGLLAEQYDPVAKRQLGNFPQAFSHVGLINTALNLSKDQKPAEQRSTAPAEAEPLAAR